LTTGSRSDRSLQILPEVISPTGRAITVDFITGAEAGTKKPALRRVAHKQTPATIITQQESSASAAVILGDSIPVSVVNLCNQKRSVNRFVGHARRPRVHELDTRDIVAAVLQVRRR